MPKGEFPEVAVAGQQRELPIGTRGVDGVIGVAAAGFANVLHGDPAIAKGPHGRRTDTLVHDERDIGEPHAATLSRGGAPGIDAAA